MCEKINRGVKVDICDACGGEGVTASKILCMCGGTGKMSDAARWLREQLLRTEVSLNLAVRALEDVHRDLIQDTSDYRIALAARKCSEALNRVKGNTG